MFLFTIVSFLAGVLTLFASCVLPLLPIIVGGSMSSNGTKREKFIKKITIILSLCISIIVFTFLLKVSTLFINVPEIFWKYLSGIILIAFGIVTIFPNLWARLTAKINMKSQKIMNDSYKSKSKTREILLGVSLGPVFASCSPIYFFILANILPTDKITGLIYLIFYTAGLGLALYIVSILGDKILSKTNTIMSPTGKFMKTIGVIILIVGISIITGYDKKAELYLTGIGYNPANIENKLLKLSQNNNKDMINKNQNINCDTDSITDENAGEILICPVDAPEFVSPDGYVNTNNKSIKLSDYKGKVVLLEFWTYSCINCQHVIPYLNSWYEKYESKGFVVIGVHTPEFAFEKNIENVIKANKDLGIKWPSVLDNNYQTWKSYNNNYWPHKYLINRDGKIIYHHIGEGGYKETEKLIQDLLNTKEVETNIITPDNSRHTGETYFGSLRNRTIYNTFGKSGINDFVYENDKYIGLSGKWNIQDEYNEAMNDNSKIHLPFLGKKAFCIFTATNPQDIIVKGEGVDNKTRIEKETLYNIASFEKSDNHKLEISTPKGVRVYTCVFE